MKWIKKIPLVLVGLLLVALMGCSALLDAITPSYIPPKTIEYSKTEPKTFMPFTTLWDSQRVELHVSWEWKKKQLEYGFIKEVLDIHQMASAELQTKVMMPAITGLMGMSCFSIGWLGVSKPGDKKKE